MKIIKPLAVIILASFFGGLHAAEYYLDYANGSDANDGSAASPWKTLGYAVATASANDVLILKKGRHVITSTITVGKALEIRGEGEKDESVITSDNKGKWQFIVSADGTVVHNLTFADFKHSYLNTAVKMNSESVISNIVLRGFSIAEQALYITKGVLTQGYVTNNTAKTYLIYSNGGIVENCVVAGNKNTKSTQAQAGIIRLHESACMRNCTVVDNTVTGTSLPLYMAGNGNKVYNCIFAGNLTSSGEPRNFGGRWCNAQQMAKVLGNCIYPFAVYNLSLETQSVDTTDNFDFDPMLSEDGMHILKNSPCNGGGLAGVDSDGVAYASTYDMDGVLRGEPPSIGAFEYVKPAGMALTPKYSAELAHAPEVVKLWCEVDGTYAEPLTFAWDNDGDGAVDSTEITNVLSQVGVYSGISVKVTDANGLSETVSFEDVFCVHEEGASLAYIDCENGDDAAAGTRDAPWKTLAGAVSNPRIADGDRICLLKGRHVLDASLTVDKAVDIHGEDGDESSCIVAVTNTLGRFHIAKSGAAVRDLTLVNEGVTSGNTLVYMVAEGLVSNIVVTSAFEASPAKSSKTLLSIIAGTLSGCLIEGNYAAIGIDIPVGANADTLIENCAIVNNRFYGDYCAFYIQSGVDVRNCTIAGNTAVNGSVAFRSRAGNYYNNIIYGNVGADGTMLAPYGSDIKASKWYTNCVYGVSTLTEADEPVSGAGNFDADPLFKNAGCRLLASASPCINAGDNAKAARSSVDIFGNPRVFAKRVDLGCAEMRYAAGLHIIVR